MTMIHCDGCRVVFDASTPGARFPGNTDHALCPDCATPRDDPAGNGRLEVIST